MDPIVVALAVLALIALSAIVWLLVRGRPPRSDSPFAASTEGAKRCPRCGMGNLWTERQCASCGEPLPG